MPHNIERPYFSYFILKYGEAALVVSLDKLVAHSDDVVDGKLGCRVRIEHCRLRDVLLLACDRSLDGEELTVDISHIHCGALYGETADVCGVDTHTVNKAGDLDAGIGGKIFDKTVVDNVTADRIRLVCSYRLDYVGGVFS